MVGRGRPALPLAGRRASIADARLDRRGRTAAAQRLLGLGQVVRLEHDPPVGRGHRQVGQRRAGGRVVQDDRPRVGAVLLGAEERGQGDEVGPDQPGPIDVQGRIDGAGAHRAPPSAAQGAQKWGSREMAGSNGSPQKQQR